MGNSEGAEKTAYVTFPLLTLAGIGFQLIGACFLWSQTSDTPEFLGRYSRSYVLILAVNLALTLGWIGIFLWRGKVTAWATAIPNRLRIILIILSGLVIQACWFLPVKLQIVHYLLGNWLLGATLLIYAMPDEQITARSWRRFVWLILLALFVLFPPILITAISDREFSPDEAIWADVSSSLYVVNGMYRRLALDEPRLVTPGLGWINALYGALLQYISFDIRTGRIVNFCFYLLAILGIGLVARKLYNSQVALLSMTFAYLGSGFFPVIDYRPDHFVPVGQLLTFYAAIAARQHLTHRRYFWHAACGLVATLALQLHPSTLGFTVGICLFYVAEFLVRIYRCRKLTPNLLLNICSFGIGAALGVVFFLVFNILPVGGLQPYLSSLIGNQYTTRRELDYLIRWTSIELFLIAGSFTYLLWRRSGSDKLYLSLTTCSIVGIFFADTQGYIVPYRAMLLLPVGVLVGSIFYSEDGERTIYLRTVWFIGCIIVVMIGQAIVTNVNWNTLTSAIRTGQLPIHTITLLTEEIASRIGKEDVIVGTHELIWGLQSRQNYYGMMAETNPMRAKLWDSGIDLWRQIQPDIIIDIPNRLPLSPGLREYMGEVTFIPCEEFHSAGYQVIFYRRVCK